MPSQTPRIPTSGLAIGIGATLASLAWSGAVHAQDSFIVGPRALGMGGANVAVTDDYTAQFYNPGAFGFFRERNETGERTALDNNDIGRKSWGFGVDAGAGSQVQGQMGRYLDQLQSVDYQRLGAQGVQNAQDVQDLVKVANGLAHVNDTGNAVSGEATGGVGFRFPNPFGRGSFGLGARGFFQATGKVQNVDRTNLGFSVGNLDTQITASGASGDGTVQVFTPAQQAQLSGAGLSANSIQVLDLNARTQGVTPAEAQGFTDLLTQIAATTGGAGGGPLSSNTTSVVFRGFGLGEVPLTYGRSIGPMLSVGASVKLMVGRVYGTSVLVFSDNADQAFSNMNSNYRQTINVGVDVGAMLRLPKLQVGLVGRNLNAPNFKGPTVNGVTFNDVRVDPQATLGVAFIPFTTLAIEADCDLNPASTTLDGYDTQRLSGGIEWNIGHVLALRAGAFTNLSENDVPYVVTGGIGLNLFLIRLDISAGASPKREQFNGHQFPKEAHAAVGVQVDF